MTLTITDADGRQSTSTQQVIVSGPPHAAFTATEQGITAAFTFKDESTPGVDGPAIVGWAWNFGDSRLRVPGHLNRTGPLAHLQRPRHLHGHAHRHRRRRLASLTTLQVTAPAARSVASTPPSSSASSSGRLPAGWITAYKQNGRPASVKNRWDPSCPARVT